MIREYVIDLAVHMGIQLPRESERDGRSVGCLDAYLLDQGSKDQLVSALLHQSELNDLQNGFDSNRLELKIRAALLRLQMVMEP